MRSIWLQGPGRTDPTDLNRKHLADAFVGCLSAAKLVPTFLRR
jgi:hypothetical protein